MTRSTAVLAGVLVLVCGLVAWEWYAQVGRGGPAPQPVRQIAAASPASSATPSASAPSPTTSPVVYVPAPVRSHAPPPAAVVTPSPSPTSEPSVRLTPYAAGGTGAVSKEPMVAATLGPHAMNAEPMREAPDAPPRILSMSISTPVAHGGQIVSGTVETTSNVASVEARIAGYSSSMQKVGVGRFALTYRVPYLPFFLHRTYTIEVIARNSRGDAVSSSLPITIR